MKETALNYRLRFCMMSMGLLTAHGDPHMFPVLTVMLRSREQQRPQSLGALIFPSVCSLPLRRPHPPPLRGRSASLPLLVLLSWRPPLSSRHGLARVLVCLAAAPHGFPGLLITSGATGDPAAPRLSREKRAEGLFLSPSGSGELCFMGT